MTSSLHMASISRERPKLSTSYSRQGLLQRFGVSQMCLLRKQPYTDIRVIGASDQPHLDFIPFLTFTPMERAVVAHKFLLEMVVRIRLPVLLAGGPHQQLRGVTRLRMRKDGTVYSALAANHYHPGIGACSLRMAVENVFEIVTNAYLKTGEESRESWHPELLCERERR